MYHKKILLIKTNGKKQLEEVGFTVQLYDITENTFIPYFSYLLRYFHLNNAGLNIISQLILSLF